MTAVEILKMLKKTPRLTPVMIASKLGKATSHVRNVLSVLLELKLVHTPARGVYEITELGNELLKELSNGDEK